MIELSRLDPKVRLLWIVGSLIPAGVLAVVAIGLFLADVPIAPWIVGGLGGFIALTGLVLASARWRSWGYHLSENELFVRFGVVVRTQRWIPRTRVQYVDMIGGPIERALGLRNVTVYTAGSRLADLSIPGLPLAAAELLREDLLSWSREAVAEQPAGHTSDAVGAFDDELPSEPGSEGPPLEAGESGETLDQDAETERLGRSGPEAGVPPVPPWTT